MSLLTALLFLVHPVQTQAVTYISQRFASLAAFFALSSVLLYMVGRKAKTRFIFVLYYLASLISALMAYKTKENVITIVLAIFLIELLIIRDKAMSRTKKLLILVPYILLIATLIPVYTGLEKPLADILDRMVTIKETESISRLNYLYTKFRVIVTYFRLLILPIKQSIEYYYPISQSLFELRSLLSLLLIMIIMIGAYYYRHKIPAISFAIFWFFAFLLVESSVIPIADVIFEHRVYLPSVRFFIAVVSAAYLVAEKINRTWLIAVLIVPIVFFAIATYARNEVWKDRLSIWQDCVKKYPQNARCHTNVGVGYAAEGKCDKAIIALEKTIELNPRYLYSYPILAHCLIESGAVEQAIHSLNYAIKSDPGYVSFYYQLGFEYLDSNRLDIAIPLLLGVLQINNKDAMINNMLGRAYCQGGNIVQALLYFDQAIKLESSKGLFYRNKAMCLFGNQRWKESRTNCIIALQKGSDNADCILIIGRTYEIEGDVVAAQYYYQSYSDAKNQKTDSAVP